MLVLVGAGVTPNTTAIAVWNIVQHTDEEAPNVPPAATAISVSTTRPTTLLDIVAVPSGAPTVKTYTLDPNCRALSLLFRNTGLTGNSEQYTVTGGTTGYIYINNQTPSVDSQRPALNLVQINGAIEKTVIISLTGGPAGHSALVYIAEEFDPLLIAVESIADAANVIVTPPNRIPTELAFTCAHGANSTNPTGGQGFELFVPIGANVDAAGRAAVVCLGIAATNTFGKELFPGGYYARSDFQSGNINVWNPAAADNTLQVTQWN